MEQVIDAVIAQLNEMRQLPHEDGGFQDDIELVDEIWWDDPKVLPEQSYPFMFVEPVTTVKTSETTQDIVRTETVRIGLVVDPRDYYNAAEITEVSASREMVRTMEQIERWFEKTTLRQTNGLCANSRRLEVGTTIYGTQLRGSLYSSSAQVTLEVDVQYPRHN